MFNTKKPETAKSVKATPPVETSTTSNELRPRVVADNSQSLRLSADTQESSTISEGCFIKGEVSGKNSIVILGKVDGTISLQDNVVTIETCRRQ